MAKRALGPEKIVKLLREAEGVQSIGLSVLG